MGNLTVGESLGGQLGDAVLARGERVGAHETLSARARPGGVEFCACAGGELVGAAAIGGVESDCERFACFDAVARAAHGGAEIDHGARVLEPGWTVVECLRGLFEPGDGCVAVSQQRAGA